MSTNLIADFNVVSLNDDDRPLRTWVSHIVSADGLQDCVRIEQEEYDEDDEHSVVLLTRQDFDRIAAQLKGH